MSKYLLRLDDASDFMDVEKWLRMEELLAQYDVKPIFGIIPKNADVSLVSKYERNPGFWGLIQSWIGKGWTPAMHGYEHCYVTENGGINPVNKRSEFAGLPYAEQREKLEKGYAILKGHGVEPKIFFAPSHTFDEDTLKALEDATPIRVISDTIANDIYKKGAFWFIPQQSGRVRKLPFKTVTFCYHPNAMNDVAFNALKVFLNKNHSCFSSYLQLQFKEREINRFDLMLRKIYFIRH